MKKIPLFCLMFIFMAFSGCSSTSNLQSSNLLMQNNWVLYTMKGKDLDAGKFMNGLPFLNFMEDDKLGGFAGCNNFSGNFAINEAALKLNPGGMTRKACEGSGENEFVAVLANVTNYKVKRDKLTLMNGKEELMSFIPQKRK